MCLEQEDPEDNLLTQQIVQLGSLTYQQVYLYSKMKSPSIKINRMKILRSRLYELERSRIDQERSQDRKTKIGTGDRSERIRTYNFPQGRVTDHRINLTLHKLDEFLEERL